MSSSCSRLQSAETARLSSKRLAREFAEQVEREPWDILGLIGGDGARETLAQLGASGIRIVDSLLEGVPLGLVVGGRG